MPAMTRAARRVLLPCILAGLVGVPAGPAHASFGDVPTTHWAHHAITYVAETHPWMRDYGGDEFRPETRERRKHWARTLVMVFAPDEPIDPRIHFPDLADDDPFFRYANVATKLGWVPPYPSGRWVPTDPMRMAAFDRSLVLALGLRNAVDGLADIHEGDGDRFELPQWFPYLQIGRALGFHFNHEDETEDIQSSTFMKRDEVAYSLWKAATLAGWQLDRMERFENITLGWIKADQTAKRAFVQYALEQVGQHPYIWAGEWNAESPAGYCCGYQPQAGFDCSGFVWWTLKRNEGGYDAARFRPYAGWSLPERSSSEMARYTPSQIAFGNLRIGDLMFFTLSGGEGWDDVNHVALWVGNGWMIHAASSTNGVAIEWVGDGYYRDRFAYGRRVIGGGSLPAHPVTEDVRTAGDPGVS